MLLGTDSQVAAIGSPCRSFIILFASACSSTSPSVCSKALGGAGIFPAVLGEISRARLCSGLDSRCGDCVGEGFFSVLRIIFETGFIRKKS